MSHGYICVQHIRRSTDCKHDVTYEPSWIKEWENVKGASRSQCMMATKEGQKYLQCPRKAEVGAHVLDTDNKKVYIIPACKRCNNDGCMEDQGHCAFAHKDMLMALPECICPSKDERNFMKSRFRLFSPERKELAKTVAYSITNPSISSSPTTGSIVNYGLKELFDEMETIMKASKFPNYWKSEESEHKKELSKFSKQKASNKLDVKELTLYIKDMLEPIEISKKQINELIDKVKTLA